MDHDLHNKVKGRLVSLSDINSNDTHTGVVIDTLGFESLEYFISFGLITDGNYDFLLEEDDDVGFVSPMPLGPDEILGSTIGFTNTESFSLTRIGILGKKRYQRLNIVSTNVTVGVNRFCVTGVLGDANVNPVPDVLEVS